MKTKNLLLVTALLMLASCSKEKLRGCMDPLAENFNQNAAESDGSCMYATPSQSQKLLYKWTWSNLTITLYINGIMQAPDVKTFSSAWMQFYESGNLVIHNENGDTDSKSWGLPDDKTLTIDGVSHSIAELTGSRLTFINVSTTFINNAEHRTETKYNLQK